jgi:formate-dependent nitrite reductase membrane component NrfD
MIDYQAIMYLIIILLYLIFHNLKIRRHAHGNSKKFVNSIFGTLMFYNIVFFVSYSGMLRSKTIGYFSIILAVVIFVYVFSIIRRNIVALRHILVNAFESKGSVLESLFITLWLCAGFIYDIALVISFFVFGAFVVKEGFLISELKKVFDSEEGENNRKKKQ